MGGYEVTDEFESGPFGMLRYIYTAAALDPREIPTFLGAILLQHPSNGCMTDCTNSFRHSLREASIGALCKHHSTASAKSVSASSSTSLAHS